MPDANDTLYTGTTQFFAHDLRQVWQAFTEGVLTAEAFAVTAGATGLSIDVAAGTAFVDGDEDPDQGRYRCYLAAPVNSDSFPAGGIPEADPDDPRVDLIVLHAYDDEYDDSGQEGYQLEVVAGTPTTGADLTNRDGAAALPDDALWLADVLVEAGAVAITAPDVGDHRVLSGGGGGGGSLTVGQSPPRFTDLTFDDFSTDTTGDYDNVLAGVFFSDPLTDHFSVTGSILERGDAGNVAVVHNVARGDGPMGFEFGTDAVTPGESVAILRYLDDNNFLYCDIEPAGGSPTLNIGAFVAGAPTGTLAASADVALAAFTSYWIRASIVDTAVAVALYDVDPEIGSPSPIATAVLTMPTGGVAEAFAGVDGGVGFMDTASRYYYKFILDGTTVAPITADAITFVAGPGISVTVDDDGSGGALVTITAT